VAPLGLLLVRLDMNKSNISLSTREAKVKSSPQNTILFLRQGKIEYHRTVRLLVHHKQSELSYYKTQRYGNNILTDRDWQAILKRSPTSYVFIEESAHETRKPRINLSKSSYNIKNKKVGERVK
jgi:hypothetical protein